MRPVSSSDSAARTARFDRWFDFPRATTPSVAHDGRTVYLLSDRAGHPQAWQVGSDGGEPTLYFGGPERVGRVAPRPDGPGAVVPVDRGGNEHYQLVLTDPAGRAVRALTDNPQRIHSPGAWSEGGVYYFTSNERDVRFFDVYRVDTHAALAPALLRAEDALVDVVDAREDRVLLVRSNTNLDRDLLLREGGRETNLLPHDQEVLVTDAALAPDRVYLAANPDREFAALLSVHPHGGAPETLASFDGDLERLVIDRYGRNALLAWNDRGYSRLVVFEPSTGHRREVELPVRGVVGTLATAPDGERFYFDLSAPTLGTEVFSLDARTGEVRALSRASRPFPGTPVPAQLGSARASDGLEIPFWWYEPAVPPRGTVVYVHGGPEAQARPSYLPLFGLLLEEGFRLIVPNVRGSLGYGKTYLHLDDVRLRMDSVRDLKEVVEAVRAGRTKVPSGSLGRIGVIGGSYGGFMVLSSISTYPELFDAAVDVVGISNFVTFLERTGPWRRKVREDEYGSLERDREFLRSISPLHHADRIGTPLLVVHGENDPRVPLFEAEQIVTALRSRQVPVELLTFPDEGHGLVRRANQRVAYVRATEFFAHHLASSAPGAP